MCRGLQWCHRAVGRRGRHGDGELSARYRGSRRGVLLHQMVGDGGCHD